MKRIYLVGTLRAWNGQRKVDMDLFVKAEVVEGRLSMKGVGGPYWPGLCLGTAGQIDMCFAHRNPRDNDQRYPEPTQPSEIKFAPGWDAEKWLDLLDVWKTWHRNDMRAGSPVQEEYLWLNPIHAVYPETYYEKASALLAEAGLNPDQNGYKYGSAWLKEELPKEIVAFLESLPKSPVKPAWI